MVVTNIGAGDGDGATRNDGKFGMLEGFACLLAGMVVFKTFFAIIHTCKWNFRYLRNPNYMIYDEGNSLERAFR